MQELAEVLEKIKKKDQQILVAGAGESGTYAARMLKKKGFNVFMIDEAVNEQTVRKAEEIIKEGIEICLGEGVFKHIQNSSLVVVSPGIPPSSRIIKEAKEEKKLIASELDVSFTLLSEKPKAVIGVTGTNGKSTVTTLISAILKSKFEKVITAGNIGTPLAAVVDEVDSETYLVLELSSFQLYYSNYPGLGTGVILNITPDHFDWHKDFEEYTEAKFKIAKLLKSSGRLILNADDEVVASYPLKSTNDVFWFGKDPYKSKLKLSAYEQEGWIFVRAEKEEVKVVEREKFKLPGKHNTENLLAAVLACYLTGVESESIAEAVESYKPLSHRMEVFAEIDGIRFIDDSKATNSDAAIRAVESLSSSLILLAGGRAKESDFSQLARVLAEKNGAAIVFGEAGKVLEEQFKNAGIPVRRFETMKEAAEFSFKAALNLSAGLPVREALTKNDADLNKLKASMSGEAKIDVLLSPACASFDEFSSYAERGETFQRIIKEAIKEFLKS